VKRIEWWKKLRGGNGRVSERGREIMRERERVRVDSYWLGYSIKFKFMKS